MSAETTRTWWRCLDADCGEAGVYDQALTGGAAEKHTEQSGHATVTSVAGPVPERIITRPKRETP